MNPELYADAMRGILEGFGKTVEEMARLNAANEQLAAQQAENTQRTRDLARATYDASTTSGKGRFVTALVESEQQRGGAAGAQARVAQTLNLSPARVSQVVRSERNRKNGK